MPWWKFGRKTTEEMEETGTITYENNTFKPGELFPPENAIERIAKYRRLKKLYDGKQIDLYERARTLLKDTPHAKQLETLFIAVNIADIIVTKPADMLVGEKPVFESGLPHSSPQQVAINSYVEENDVHPLLHESALANGYRGDAWIKQRFGYKQDFSELANLGVEPPADVRMEPIIEHVSADCVFPVTSDGNVKSFKAVVIASVEWVVSDKKDLPFLNVERHLPGYIIYERYQLETFEGGVNTKYGAEVQLFKIREKVGSTEIEETGVPRLLVQHIPYKSTDDAWQGKGTLETVESLIYAINDRLTQIDYILWKHSDPTAYGPPLESTGNARLSGRYIELEKDDKTPGYMTWDGQLNSAFKELEVLVGLVFQTAETPQWLFGTVLGDQNSGGTGTSHTDGAAIKARFMPILTKVARIRTHYDRAIRDALYNCQLLDIAHNDKKFEAVYPSVTWRDGLPKNEKEEAEIIAIRTGGKATLDVKSAIKRQDNVDDMKAEEIIGHIKDDEERETGTVDPSIYNRETEVREESQDVIITEEP